MKQYIRIINVESCVTSDGTHLYVIGGRYELDRVFSEIYRYTPPTSGNYISNNSDDIWILMGNMRYKLSERGCTTDKLSRYLYMIGGIGGSFNSRAGNGEYIDLNEYELYGFNNSYYDMGKIICTGFRNLMDNSLSECIEWRYPNCFSSQYSDDVIYCGGGLHQFLKTNEIWKFERFYSPESYTYSADPIRSPEIYGCSKGPNYNEYFFYPECAGFIGHNIKKYLEPGPHNSDVIYAPREYRFGCDTPWYSVNTNFSIRFYLGGQGSRNFNEDNPLIMREDSYLFQATQGPTITPTISPTIIPTVNPTNTPTNNPTNLTKSPTDKPTKSPLIKSTQSGSQNEKLKFTKALTIIFIIIIILLLAIIITFIIYKYYTHFKESQISNINKSRQDIFKFRINPCKVNIFL